MKGVRAIIACAGALLPALAGCGSGSSAPFGVSCSVHRLAPGLIRAYVTVTNNTGSARGRAIIYGPPFDGVRHIYPVWLLSPTHVAVTVSHARQIYTGFVVFPVSHKKPARLILRFVSPPHAESIVVTTRRLVRASSWDVLKNDRCVVRR